MIKSKLTDHRHIFRQTYALQVAAVGKSMVFNRRNTVTNRDLFESGTFIKCVGSNRLQCARKRDTLQILALLERSVADRLDRDAIDLLRDDHLRDSIIAVHDFALFHIHINITARDRDGLARALVRERCRRQQRSEHEHSQKEAEYPLFHMFLLSPKVGNRYRPASEFSEQEYTRAKKCRQFHDHKMIRSIYGAKLPGTSMCRAIFRDYPS